MAFNIVLHFASENRTLTIKNVVSFEIEWGDQNIVHYEKEDGTTDSESGVGLTVSSATDTEVCA